MLFLVFASCDLIVFVVVAAYSGTRRRAANLCTTFSTAANVDVFVICTNLQASLREFLFHRFVRRDRCRFECGFGFTVHSHCRPLFLQAAAAI